MLHVWYGAIAKYMQMMNIFAFFLVDYIFDCQTWKSGSVTKEEGRYIATSLPYLATPHSMHSISRSVLTCADATTMSLKMMRRRRHCPFNLHLQILKMFSSFRRWQNTDRHEHNQHLRCVRLNTKPTWLLQLKVNRRGITILVHFNALQDRPKSLLLLTPQPSILTLHWEEQLPLHSSKWNNAKYMQ